MPIDGLWNSAEEKCCRSTYSPKGQNTYLHTKLLAYNLLLFLIEAWSQLLSLSTYYMRIIHFYALLITLVVHMQQRFHSLYVCLSVCLSAPKLTCTYCMYRAVNFCPLISACAFCDTCTKGSALQCIYLLLTQVYASIICGASLCKLKRT